MICLQVQEILDEDEALSTDPSQGRQRTRRVLAMRHVRYCCGQRFFFFNLSDGSITNAKSAVSLIANYPTGVWKMRSVQNLVVVTYLCKTLQGTEHLRRLQYCYMGWVLLQRHLQTLWGDSVKGGTQDVMLNWPDSLIYIFIFQIYPLVWRIWNLAKVGVFTQDLLKNYQPLIN